MLQFSKTIEAAVANLSGAMESRDHFKNGASSKILILMSRENIMTKILRMSRLKFTLFGMLILFLSSCEDKEPKKERQTPLFPLSVGNSWSYDNISYNGGEPNTVTTQMNIKYSYKIDGITGFSFNEYKIGDPISLLENDESGNLVEHFFNNDKFVYSSIRYKKDAKKGDHWLYRMAVYSNGDFSKYEIEEITMTCTTSDTIIIIPKGNFHCIGFSYHPGGEQENGDPNHTMIDFVSENVGQIKTLHYEHERGNTWLFSERVLTDYSLK